VTTALDAQAKFAAEFALFLVAVAGLALSLLRPELLTRSAAARLALSVGFAALAGAAFVYGSLIIEEVDDPIVVIAQSVGWAAVFLGALRWTGGVVSKRLVLAGVLAGAIGVGAALAEAGSVAAAARAVGAVAFGSALIIASRGAIAARVAASAAATLLLVVLVLSVGLSAVLTTTVEDQAIAAVDARALREASHIEEARNQAITAAGILSAGLATPGQIGPIIVSINDARAATPEQTNQLSALLAQLGDLLPLRRGEIAFAYADANAGVVAAAGLPPADFAQLATSRAAVESVEQQRSTGDVVALGDKAAAVGIVPVRTNDTHRFLGMVIAAIGIDESYLQERSGAEDPVSLALWGPGGPLSSFGDQPRARDASELASAVLVGGDGSSTMASGRFVSARAVRSQDNRPLFALVASRSTDAVEEIRERLFRTFFVIAFGGTLLALLLASFVGDRIGSGVRRLTRSVEALERGEPGVRSGVAYDDEVGRLGAAFDSMAASIEDKTDALRRAALDEARLRNRLEAVVAGMGEALVAVDEAGTITDFNDAAEDLFGRSADTVKGVAVAEVVAIANEDGVDLSDRLTEGDDARWSELAEVASSTGEPIPVAVTSGPLRGPDGEVTGRVLVFRDLRAEREVERMKREFLSRVGHELRTPLTPMLGYARILAGRNLPSDRARDIAHEIVTSGERLERIVEMLEFFASAQAGRTVLQPEPVDVRELLTGVVQERQKSANGHVLVRRVRSGTPPVLGDPYWLRRSIDELLDNAIKFSPDGGRVSVTAGPVEGHVEIAVRDSGVGMSEDELERAFAEWSQGDESDTRAYGGLGLGLALVQRVAERHGGRVLCETAPGKGSKFSILLPVLQAGEDTASEDAAAG